MLGVLEGGRAVLDELVFMKVVLVVTKKRGGLKLRGTARMRPMVSIISSI